MDTLSGRPRHSLNDRSRVSVENVGAIHHWEDAPLVRRRVSR